MITYGGVLCSESTESYGHIRDAIVYLGHK
jgi:hypothetical protein